MKLYLQLLALCSNSEYDNSFYFDDHTLDDSVYRIFNYRLVGWDTFQNAPAALECRGIMYNITDEDNCKLVCRPPKKFFNYAEGGVQHSFGDVIAIHEKLDGSLISSYLHKGDLRLKSKGSLTSIQANSSMDWLEKPENLYFKEYIWRQTVAGYTVNMEWTSPENRIVVGYKEDSLRILSIRKNDSRTIGALTLPDSNPVHPSAELITRDLSVNLDDIVHEMYEETLGEGYVITLADTHTSEVYQVKVKNFKYCNLHKIKDSISNPVALATLIISGESDDVIEAFTEDPITLEVIYRMEDKIIPIYNKMINDIEQYYETNNTLSRKDYAIKCQKELPKLMPILMDLYSEKDIDYTQFAIKNMFKIFGIKNPSVEERNNAKMVKKTV